MIKIDEELKLRKSKRWNTKHKNRFRAQKDPYKITLADFYDIDCGISNKVWLKMIYRFFYYLSQEIIKEKYSWRIPYNGGKLRIKKNKKYTSSINWGITKKIGRHYREPNFHTDRYQYKWFWEKIKYNFANKKYYQFSPVLGMQEFNFWYGKRGLAYWIKKCISDPDLPEYNAPF